VRRLFGPPASGHYVLLSALLLGWPGAAHAQDRNRVRVSANVGFARPAATTFTGATTTTVYLEPAPITTSYSVPKGPFFDGGALIRVAGDFAVGATVSAFTRSDTGSIAGAIPSPFAFNTPRPLSGTAASLERREVAVHVQAAYVVSAGRLDVAISGGPSVFAVRQDLVSAVAYTESYPFDTATFTGATVTGVSATKVGFNVGADVGFKFSAHVGVGGLVRYTRASMTFPLANAVPGVSADAGGLHAGGGIRFWF
jgi:hypothetical protein